MKYGFKSCLLEFLDIYPDGRLHEIGGVSPLLEAEARARRVTYLFQTLDTACAEDVHGGMAVIVSPGKLEKKAYDLFTAIDGPAALVCHPHSWIDMLGLQCRFPARNIIRVRHDSAYGLFMSSLSRPASFQRVRRQSGAGRLKTVLAALKMLLIPYGCYDTVIVVR